MSKTDIHRMLQIALIEIRAANDLATAQAFADIFHNVPSMLALNRSDEVILETIMQKAARHGMQTYVERLRDSCTLQAE